MPDEERQITDDMLLSKLTVGEFKKLLQSILLANPDSTPAVEAESPLEQIAVRRKSLDEFMNDLGEKK